MKYLEPLEDRLGEIPEKGFPEKNWAIRRKKKNIGKSENSF